MKLSHDTIARLLRFDDMGSRFPSYSYGVVLHDYASSYGEPSYNTWSGMERDEATTPMVLLGDWWLRDSDNKLQHFGDRWPRLFSQLEAQGVQMDWYDEYIVIHDKAYRATHDSYSWQPSYVWLEGWDEPLTMEEITNDRAYFMPLLVGEMRGQPTKAINLNGFRTEWLEELGYEQLPREGHVYQHGWYGREDDPKRIMQRYSDTHDEDSILFVIDGVGQFATDFTAWGIPIEVLDDEFDPDSDDDVNAVVLGG